jgi:flagellar biosynthetic protein FlhB
VAEQDDAQKTEQPTDRRIRESREKGQVAVSQDVRTWGILVGAVIFAAFLAPILARQLTPILARILEISGTAAIEESAAPAAAAGMLGAVGWTLAPLLALVIVLAVAAGLGQSGFIWAPSRITMELGRLSPIKGFGRLFSLTAVVDFLKGLAKLAVVAVIGTTVALPLMSDVALMPAWPVIDGLERLHSLSIAIITATAAVMAVVALLDYAFQQHKHLRNLRMTRQEVRDEMKQSEGDPHVKAKIRRLRAERARQRMMAAVPKADVVVTNPTHYSVALAYVPAAMAAPKVVAKGVDTLARRIREVAEEAGVPVMENPPLARSLYASVEIDREIPTEHYQAVAEVIAFVMRQRTGGARP